MTAFLARSRVRACFGLLALALAAPATVAQDAAPLLVERAVLVMRHGIRAPLGGEVPAGTRAGAPWPRWPVEESRLTPHGARALEIVAAADRRLLAAHGLLAANGCPAPGDVRIWANSSDRTVASGEAYARGFAPACPPAVGHRPLGEADPLFEPLRAADSGFDAAAAIADIDRATGGMEALVRRHRAELRLLDRVLGCRPVARDCVSAPPAGIAADDSGRAIRLDGQIRATSGIAQVLLLQYLQGMPLDRVGWGRAGPVALRRLGRLHAALFDVFTRPPYMAAHQAAPLGARIIATLAATDGPRLDVLVGHDTNVTAVAAALGVPLRVAGYATNDVPPDGALLFERLRDTRSGRTFVRAFYRTQPPLALRRLTRATSLTPLPLPGCSANLCQADRFARAFAMRLAH